MPVKWVDAIDADCLKKGWNRSQWMREAAKKYFPALADLEEE